MKKPLKIIHLTSFISGEKPPNHPKIGDDYYFVASWAGLIARRLKKFRPDLDIETWRAEDEVDKKIERIVFDIKGIIWPYKKPLVKNLLTLDMVKHLNNLKKSHKIILHYHNLLNLRFVILFKYFCPGINLVLSHHGGIPPKLGTLKDILMKIYYNKKRISYITYLSPKTLEYLKSVKNHPPLQFLPVGADFNFMKPSEKHLIRKKIGLDTKKVYAIYVGKYYSLKNVDLILKAYNELKYKYNFSIIFVGGSKMDELYDEVLKSGCPNFGVQPWINMKDFYSAADFYIHPAFNPQFGGLDVSWIEALACNRPVLSPQLSYLDFDYNELGLVLTNKEELVEKTEWMINNYAKFTKCREVAQKHLDGNTVIMEKLIRIYEEIHIKDNSHN